MDNPIWNACTMDPHGWMRDIECHPGFASYLQTTLTIIALGIAIAAPIFAQWLAARAEVRRMLGIVAGASTLSFTTLRHARTQLLNEKDAYKYMRTEFDPSILEGAAQTLQSIPIDKLPGFRTSRALIEIIDATVSTNSALSQAATLLRVNGQFAWADTRDILDAADTKLKKAVAVIEEAHKRGRDE